MDLNKKFELLFEGVHDKGIFKAIFLTGGPGSGKDYVLKNALSGFGLTEISSTKILDHLENLHTLHPNKARNINEIKHILSINGRNGLVINDSGDHPERVKDIKKRLEKMGYDTFMIHVHVDDDVSRQRNIERSKRGGRAISERVRKFKWENVQDGRVIYAKMFGNNYIEYDNSDDMRTVEPEVIKQKKDELNGIREHIQEFVNTQPSSEVSQSWIQSEMEKNNDPIPRNGSKLPHPTSEAAKQADEAGLIYFGKGRYGDSRKARTVTHVAINDTLVEVPTPDPDERDVKKIKESNEYIDTLNGENEIPLLKSFCSFRKLKESIDRGIEPGLSMATAGENFSRDVEEKKLKDKNLKELTGDESTDSIGNVKQDELKKSGISLMSFKSKQVL